MVVNTRSPIDLTTETVTAENHRERIVALDEVNLGLDMSMLTAGQLWELAGWLGVTAPTVDTWQNLLRTAKERGPGVLNELRVRVDLYLKDFGLTDSASQYKLATEMHNDGIPWHVAARMAVLYTNEIDEIAKGLHVGPKGGGTYKQFCKRIYLAARADDGGVQDLIDEMEGYVRRRGKTFTLKDAPKEEQPFPTPGARKVTRGNGDLYITEEFGDSEHIIRLQTQNRLMRNVLKKLAAHYDFGGRPEAKHEALILQFMQRQQLASAVLMVLEDDELVIQVPRRTDRGS